MIEAVLPTVASPCFVPTRPYVQRDKSRLPLASMTWDVRCGIANHLVLIRRCAVRVANSLSPGKMRKGALPTLAYPSPAVILLHALRVKFPKALELMGTAA